MDNKENHMRDVAAKARIKRKNVLDQRKLSRNSQTRKDSPSTPLADISCSTLNQQNSLNREAHNEYTQPSSHLISLRKRYRVGTNSVGVNLINRFQEGNQSFAASSSCKSTTNILQKETYGNSATCDSSLHSAPAQDVSNTNFTASIYFQETQDNQSDSSDMFEEDEHLDATNTTRTDTGSEVRYSDIGDPIWECQHCLALMWYQERMRKHKHTTIPKFHMCCGDGKVQLPYLTGPPSLLQHLLFDSDSADAKNFQQNIRVYNMMFAFTSPGIKLDKSIINGRGPPNIRIQGQACHRIGSLLPMPKHAPKFSQLYIYDTEHEIQNRLQLLRDRSSVEANIVGKLTQMLDDHNIHAKSFRKARDQLKSEPVHDIKLQLISKRCSDGRIHNLPTVSEVAALIVGDVDSALGRDIILQKQNGQLQRIDELHTSYLALQYPLLFPYGEDGYRHDVLHRDTPNSSNSKRIHLTIREWLCFRIQTRANEAQTLIRSRRLFQQFLVDGYLMIESERLSFIRRNQTKLRVDKYSNLNQHSSGQQSQGSDNGKRVILPSSFVGGRRYMDQLYFDGMAICSHVGFPDLFVTFTCNPCWPEIQRVLNPLHLKASDRPDLVARVFKIKFEDLLAELTKKHILGRVVAYMYTIEFQKRGLPHAHLLLFMHPSHKYPTATDIDKIISAEIPSQYENEELYTLVKAHMMHGPCGLGHRSAPCMINGRCSRYYPKRFQETTLVDQDGFPVYRRRDNNHTIQKNGLTLDNRSVVPYNPKLLIKFQAHINMEWCNQSSSIKYLFKYINKGYDRITAAIEPPQDPSTSATGAHDEIKQYLDCRYISPSEACWRIYSFPIHSRKPAVERMFFHLPGEQPVYFQDDDLIDDIVNKPSVSESMFTSWMAANKIYPEAKYLTYGQFVSKFVYVKTKRCWKLRKKGNTIGRLIWVPPNSGELFYLRLMLTVCKGPTSYEDIRTVDNVLYSTFKEACFAMGFLEDDKEYIEAIKEANEWGSGHFLRKLFVTMLISNSITKPEEVWKQTWHFLCDGILFEQRKLSNIPDLQLPDEEIQNLTLIEIEKILENSRKSLKDYPKMPYPSGYVQDYTRNRLIYAELNYDHAVLKAEFETNFRLMTDEQRSIFQKIAAAVSTQQGGMFFLYGYGGTGKTFMWKTLASALRSQNQIVLTVASSGIASLLLPGGRTAHSKFKIPVPVLDNSICNIQQGSELAGLLKKTQLIIWDEAPMAHKYCFEALDKSLRDIMGFPTNSNLVFGGKVIVFGRDFRQILPVIPKGDRSDIVHSAINASYLWDHCQVLTLTENMRLKGGQDNTNVEELKQFAEWILDVGDGKCGEANDGYTEIEIPHDLLISEFEDPIAAIVESTYPDLEENYNSHQYLESRAVLASTIETVERINDYVLSKIPGEEKEYLSSDSIDMSDVHENQAFATLTPEFLHSLRTSGLPNHSIKLKIGTPIMLLRNLDQSEGLCNGTRLVVTRLANHVIEAKVMIAEQHATIVYIPRMSLSPSQSPWPFKLIRRQFPIIISYAMTINKSQGQSLQHVGLYLPKPVFSHGQLYVAISRVRSKHGLKILIHDSDKKPMNKTINVVYKEVFHNLHEMIIVVGLQALQNESFCLAQFLIL